jgi:hypothetical protein
LLEVKSADPPVFGDVIKNVPIAHLTNNKGQYDRPGGELRGLVDAIEEFEKSRGHKVTSHTLDMIVPIKGNFKAIGQYMTPIEIHKIEEQAGMQGEKDYVDNEEEQEPKAKKPRRSLRGVGASPLKKGEDYEEKLSFKRKFTPL